MIKINPDQVKSKLGSPYYLILGGDPYLQTYTQTEIEIGLKTTGFDEKLVYLVDAHTDWTAIYDSCQSMNLFSSKTLIVLDFADGSINASITSKLNSLVEQISPEIGLIIKLNKMSKAQENAPWFKALSANLTIINCTTPDNIQLPQWIRKYLKEKQIIIEDNAIELLCYHYEGNLLALTQLIEQLTLLCDNTSITYDQVEKNINDSAVFTPYHWVDAMISLKTKRAMHVLQQLKVNEFEPLILLRIIQRELILIINLKKIAQKTSLRQGFDDYKIWQNRRQIYTNYLSHRDINQLYKSLSKLTEMEIGLKQDYLFDIWAQLSLFSLDFMN